MSYYMHCSGGLKDNQWVLRLSVNVFSWDFEFLVRTMGGGARGWLSEARVLDMKLAFLPIIKRKPETADVSAVGLLTLMALILLTLGNGAQ